MEAARHLEQDPVLSELLRHYPLPAIVPAADPFAALIRGIIGQQLSVGAARAIAQRVAAATQHFDPARLLLSPPDRLRALGMSWAKVGSVQAAAHAQLSGRLNFAQLSQENDEAVIAALSALPGIGRWTAEMFLMSALSRADVFSLGDLGLKRALERHYPGQDHATRIESWRPYRSHAARLLWQSLDNAPQLEK